MTIKRLPVERVPFRRPSMGLRHRVAPAWAAIALGLLAATGGLSASASAASTPAALGGHFTASNNGVDFGSVTLGDYITAASRAAQVILYNNDEMTNTPNSVTSIDITGPDSDDFVAQSSGCTNVAPSASCNRGPDLHPRRSRDSDGNHDHHERERLAARHPPHRQRDDRVLPGHGTRKGGQFR